MNEQEEAKKCTDCAYHHSARDICTCSSEPHLLAGKCDLWLKREAMGGVITYTDTQRLNWLLQYFLIDDIGDEFACPGIVIRAEELEDALSFGPDDNTVDRPSMVAFGDNIRDVIDRVIYKFEHD